MKISFFILLILFSHKSVSQIKSLNELIEISRVSPTKIKDSLSVSCSLRYSDDNRFLFFYYKKKSLDDYEQIIQMEENSIELRMRNYIHYKEFLNQAKENNLILIKKEKKSELKIYQGDNYKIKFSQECRGKRAMYVLKLIKEK